MGRVVVIAGTPGAGKTTVLNRAMEELEKRGISYRVVNYGDIMLEIARERKLVEHRDEMRKLDPEIQKEIQREAARRIAEMARGDNVIVDTHCTIKTPKGYLPGLPRWVLEELSPQIIVLIEAHPEEILMRRIEDTSRVRDIERLRDIRIHQQMNRAAAMAYAMMTGASVKIIENHNNALEIAVEELVETLS